MSAELEFDQALAALSWQVDLGVTEAISEAPINRYELAQAAPKPPKVKSTPSQVAQTDTAAPFVPEEKTDMPAEALKAATGMAAAAPDLLALKSAIGAFDHCALKKGARNLVFADGNPVARVMIVGEAPGRDEDIEGFPFVGRAGQLLDKMLVAIDLSRQSGDVANAVYITNVLPWRPPQNRDPAPEEIAMMLPFVKRHVELVAPDILVPMGNIACQALLGQTGITRLRGNWAEVFGVKTLPMFHPAYLLRSPDKKREAWADLLAIKAELQ
jgi:uracil-DNA glycosylase